MWSSPQASESKGKHFPDLGQRPTVFKASAILTGGRPGFLTKVLVLCKPLGYMDLFQGSMKATINFLIYKMG